MQRALCALALAMAAFAPGAIAQPTVVASQATDAVTRGLVAQYEAALIRERRLADDREQHLIADYETRMRDLRARVDRGEAAAQAQLGEARTQYAAYVAPIAARDSEARQLVEGYQAQLARDIAQASPEQLAALQRFADGDQEAGFTQYQAESARRAAARQHQVEAAAQAAAQAARAADAADARQLAQLGETMRASGRKSTAEVISLYEAATTLEPNVASSWLALIRLYRERGRLQDAQRAGERGLTANPSSIERVNLEFQLGYTLKDWLQHLPEANALLMTAQGHAREILTSEPGDLEAKRLLGQILYLLAENAIALRSDYAYGSEAAQQSLAVLREVAAADPNDTAAQRAVASSLIRVADMEIALNHFVRAQEACEESLAIRRRLAAADPNDVFAQRYVGVTLERLGDVQLYQNNQADARASFEERLAVARRTAALDVSNALAQRDVWVAMQRLVYFPESGVTWAQIVAAIEEQERRGTLLPSDRQWLDQARFYAAREHTEH